MLANPSSAAGAALGCAQYFTHHLPALIEQPQPHEARDWQSQFSCAAVANKYNIDVDQLMRWNPSLSSDGCVLQPGVNYCVVKIEEPGRRKQNLCITSTNSETLIRIASVTSPDKTAGEPPICTFDPEKGEYVCDPPICTFDPQKGEYVCPKPTVTGEVKERHTEEIVELK